MTTMTAGEQYELLRPVEVWEKGTLVHDSRLEMMTLISGLDNRGNVCVEHNGSYLVVWSACTALRLAPLAWLEGKPVYSGDKLYHKVFKEVEIVRYDGFLHALVGVNSDGDEYGLSYDMLLWDKPKEKKTYWVNLYQSQSSTMFDLEGYMHPTKEKADEKEDKKRKRIACAYIEVEE